MPCFRTAPERESSEYGEWITTVTPKMEAFTHVVDYYYRAAGRPIPQPATVEFIREWFRAGALPADAQPPVDATANTRVLTQILLHLDCDGVGVFQLNDIANLLLESPTPRRLGYGFVLINCFVAMRTRDSDGGPLSVAGPAVSN
jgi:hypothetical protein